MKGTAIVPLLALAAGIASAQDCTVQGVVTDAASGRPVEGAKVQVPIAADVFTDAAGRFCVVDKWQAQRIRVTKTGYIEVNKMWSSAADITKLTMELTPVAEISGQVLDEEGRPMAGVLIYTGSSHRTTTDAEGRYEIHDLEPAKYQLYCRLLPAARKDSIQRDEKRGQVLGYNDTYYFPDTTDGARAMPVSVNPGMHAGGFDFRLRRISLVDFTGRVLDRVSGEALPRAAVQLDPGGLLTDESWKRRNVDAKGGFRFELIAPGRYSLLVYREGVEDAGKTPLHVPLEIGPAGTKDAEIRVPEYVSVMVHITAPHPELTRGGVAVSPMGMVMPVVSRGGLRMPPQCHLGEECAVKDIPPGQWMFTVMATMWEEGESRQPLYVQSVRFGQQEAWFKPVQVSEGANPPLEIVLTADVGTLAATVTGDDGKPVPAVLALKSTDGPQPQHRANCCRLSGLLPGEYEVAAFALGDQDVARAASPDVCGDRTAKVTITAGQTSVVNLRPCEFRPH